MRTIEFNVPTTTLHVAISLIAGNYFTEVNFTTAVDGKFNLLQFVIF